MLALSGCVTTDETPASLTEAEAQAAYDARMAVVLNPDLAPLTDLPGSGEVTYTGYIGIYEYTENDIVDGIETHHHVVGELSLNVNFNSESLSGEASRFSEGILTFSVDPEIIDNEIEITNPIDGSLTLEGGSLVGANWTGLAIDGTLTGSARGDWVVDAVASGNFVTADGTTPDYIYGGVRTDTDIGGTATDTFIRVFGAAD